MSRWKHLDDWPEKLAKMSADELRSELAYWKMRVRICTRTQNRKLTMKMVYQVEKALQRKLAEAES